MEEHYSLWASLISLFREWHRVLCRVNLSRIYETPICQNSMALSLNLANFFFNSCCLEMSLEAIFWNTQGFSSLEAGDIQDGDSLSALCVLQHCTSS